MLSVFASLFSLFYCPFSGYSCLMEGCEEHVPLASLGETEG